MPKDNHYSLLKKIQKKNFFEILFLASASLVFAKIMIPNFYFSETFLLSGTGDTAVYAAGNLGFLNDGWHFPIFESNLLGQDRISVTLYDAIPIFALIFKFINSVLGTHMLNYIGPWTFLVFFLQPVSSWIALKAWGLKSRTLIWVMVLTFSTMQSFMFRILHNALQAHFLIILAIGLYPALSRSPNNPKSLIKASILLLLATLTHTYLAVMVTIILVLGCADKASRTKDKYQRIFYVKILTLNTLIFLLIFLISYTMQGVFSVPINGGGWSIYSMNILGPFSTNSDRFVLGQYEGLNFLGPIGFLCLFFLVTKKRGNLGLRTKNSHESFDGIEVSILTKFALILISFLSLGSRIYLGGTEIVSITWFERVPGIQLFTNSFRAPGRLFWLVSYFIMIYGAKKCDMWIQSYVAQGKLSKIQKEKKTKRMKLSFSISLVILLVLQQALNWNQIRNTFDFMRNDNYYQTYGLELSKIVKGSKNVIVFPEFQCLEKPGSDIVVYFHLASAYNSIPINTTKSVRQNLPYSCFPVDERARFKMYLSNATSGTLFVLAGDWSQRSSQYLLNPICNKLQNIRYCYGRSR